MLKSYHMSRTISICWRSRGFRPFSKFVIRETLTTNGFKVGSSAEMTHIFTQDEVKLFADLGGDNNPLHIDPQFAKSTIFEGPIVHGILVGSLFSTLMGRSINGSIYVSQSLQFKAPVHVGAEVIAKLVVSFVEQKRLGVLLSCTTTCTLVASGKTAIVGEAKVLVPKVPAY